MGRIRSRGTADKLSPVVRQICCMYLFEVGGKGKSFNQIKDVENGYLAVDNTEKKKKNRIPLWMFGLLY